MRAGDGQSVSYYLANNSEQASLVWKDQYRVGFWEQMNRSGSWHRFRADYVSAFSEAPPGKLRGAERKAGARVRKSRQKEAAGAADADLMQIEWSEAEVLKLAGDGTVAEEEVGEVVGTRVNGRKRCERGREVGIGSGAGRTWTERGEPCSVFRVVGEHFMQP
jgi:hypothetical protein